MSNILFSPIKINSLTLKNRIVMPSMVTFYAASNGETTDQLINYYAERARGGCGLVMIEATYMEREGNSYGLGLGCDDDNKLPGLTRLTTAIHEAGAKTGLQLQHGGRTSNPNTNGGPIKIVSYIPGVTPYEGARVLTKEDIADIVRRYAEAALRAKKAGFDLVELHGAHGYLINQFLSPFTNHRSDEYGGSPENRLRFALEVLKACRKAVGPDYPLTMRLSVDEFNGTGLTLDQSLEIAKALVDNGIDALNISIGACETNRYTIPPSCIPEAYNIDRSDAVRKAIGGKVPVAVVGRIPNGKLAEEILESGKADLIVMGRALIADPYLPMKTESGLLSSITPCLACNEGCIAHGGGPNVTCAVNPCAGQEARFPRVKAATSKNVVVIGAGPAGLEAALTAFNRGHKVTLIEKSGSLGGLLNVACRPPHKAYYADFARYLSDELKKTSIEMKLNCEADVDKVKELNPDKVIVATGSSPIVPCFCKGAGALTAEEVLLGAKTGSRVLVLGGGLVGCETAEYLAEQKKSVTIIELRDTLAPDMEARSRIFMMPRLKELGIKSFVNTEVLEVAKGSVKVRGVLREERTIDDFDTLVLAFGYCGNSTLYHRLCEAGVPAVAVGDCLKAGRVLKAVHEGFKAAYAL